MFCYLHCQFKTGNYLYLENNTNIQIMYLHATFYFSIFDSVIKKMKVHKKDGGQQKVSIYLRPPRIKILNMSTWCFLGTTTHIMKVSKKQIYGSLFTLLSETHHPDASICRQPRESNSSSSSE